MDSCRPLQRPTALIPAPTIPVDHPSLVLRRVRGYYVSYRTGIALLGRVYSCPVPNP